MTRRPSITRRPSTAVAALTAAIVLGACGDDAEPADHGSYVADAEASDDTVDDTADDTADADIGGDAPTDAAGDDTRDAEDPSADTAVDGSDAGIEAPDDSPLGGDRPADVLLPSYYSAEREWPLVVMLHGFGASGLLQRVYLGLVTDVEDLGFVLVTPDGTANSEGLQFWNAWDVCCDREGSGVDDVAYLTSLLDEAEERFSIDTSRVYFIGHSNGGYMSYRMACELGSRVTGIMSLAGAMGAELDECEDNGPVAVLQIHGTLDDSVPYETVGDPPTRIGAIDSAAFWAERNGCTAGPTDGGRMDIVVAQDDETAISEWDGCERDVEVWTLEEVGHLPAVTPEFSETYLRWLFDRPAD